VVTVLAEVGQYLPDWRPGTDYRKGVSARKDLGGGVLLELSHEFDYLRWFFGDFEVAYCHAGSTGVLDIDVEDRADVIMAGGNDIVANLHLDFLQRKPTRTCKVIGSDGTLVWDAIGNSVALYGHGKSELLFEDKAGDRNQMYLDLLARFWRVSRGDAAPLIGLEHARQTLRLVDQAKSIARITRDLRVHGEAD
jgi:predicted dehydrogenase